MKSYRWAKMIWLCVCAVAVTGCSQLGGVVPGAENEQAQVEEKLKSMTTKDLLEESLLSMRKMKGYRWDSQSDQQYVFEKQPQQNTRLKWDRQLELTNSPLRLHAKGVLSKKQELVSQSTPHERYVAGDREYVYSRNEWIRKKESPEADVVQDVETANPIWEMEQILSHADKSEVKENKGYMLIFLKLEGKVVQPFIDRQTIHMAEIVPMKQPIQMDQQRMNIRLWVSKKNFRLEKVEQAVEFRFVSGLQKGKARQEWTHRLQGEAKDIQVPREIAKTAQPMREEKMKPMPKPAR
jgi:hypothetical protein